MSESVAGDGAQHEEDSGGFCPVIDLVVGGDKALSSCAREEVGVDGERRGRGELSCEELEELLDSRELEDPCGGGEMREFLASLGLTLSEKQQRQWDFRARRG